MHKRSEPCSGDLDSQGVYLNGKNKYSTEGNGDIENNSLEYFVSREKTIKILRQKGIKNLYPIQQQTYRHIFRGSDVLARDRTGSGKTMAFVLPVIERFRSKKFEHRYPKFLIILPTRELAIQVNNEIDSLRYRDEDDFVSQVVYGKTSIEENVRRLRDGVDILVATPGRLNDLAERGAVKFDSIEVICLDEADEILKQGFKEEIQKVFTEIHKVNKNKIQTLLFSATIPPWLRGLSEQYQSRDAPYINMIKDDDIRTSKTIKHLSVEISRLGENDIVKLIEDMVDKYGGHEKRILVFCDRKAEVDTLSRNLKIPNQPLHGDVPQGRREHAYRNFKAGILRCIVATNVAARGLDFPHVNLVIQMSPPINTQEYIHRAGRTGRAGKEGTCLTFFDRTKNRIISKIEDEARITIQKLTIDFSNLSNSRGGYEQNDRNDHYRDDRGRNDRFERNDRNGSSYERRDYGRGDRNDERSGGNRYGDREKESSGNNWDSRRQNNFDRNENRDPRPRPAYNNGCDRVNENRRQSRSNSPRKQEQSRKSRSRSNSRSVSKERSTSIRKRSPSPKQQRSPSPRRDYAQKPSTSKPSYDDDCDY